MADDDELDTFDPVRLAKLAPTTFKPDAAPGLDLMTAGELKRLEKLESLKQSLGDEKARRQMDTAIKRRLLRSIEKYKAQVLVGAPRPAVHKYKGPPVRLGFDAEWVTWPLESGCRNEVLCLTAVVECRGQQSDFMFVPQGPTRDDRPMMRQFIQGSLRKAMKDGVVLAVPDKVVCYGHFLRGDVSSFQDFWARLHEFSGLGKTLGSGRAGHSVEIGDETSAEGEAVAVDDSDEDNDVLGPSYATIEPVTVRSLSGQQYVVKVYFRDTIKMTPGSSKTLASAAKLVGMKKLDLHIDLGVPREPAAERPERVGWGVSAEYSKRRMDLVMRDYREAFDPYAFEDSRIALAVGKFFEKFAREELGLRRVPTTIAGAASALQTNLVGGEEAMAALVGRERRDVAKYDEKRRRPVTRKEMVPVTGLELYYQFACNAYSGGRNECFWHGPTLPGPWYDYDIPGAYTTVMAALRPLAYDRAYQELDPDKYDIDDCGVCWIEFDFPAGPRFPCLPVRTATDALVFPLRASAKDRVFVAAPEVFLARKMNAEIKVIQGIKVPWASDERIFDQLTHRVQTSRKKFPKGSMMDSLWKELGNSTYGLTAQGLKEKRVFDPATLSSKTLEVSPLSEPFFAAWVTSCVRAILGEILSKVPADGTVISATTDGLLTNVPHEHLRFDGPVCEYFSKIRARLLGKTDVLEKDAKHVSDQIVSVATRMTFTARRHPGEEPVCAKGGIKFDCHPACENAKMLMLYLHHKPGTVVTHEELVSARQQLTRELDLVSVTRTRKVRLVYDYKRSPRDPRMVSLGPGTERVAFDTDPWGTVSEANDARALVRRWQDKRARVVKTMDDFDNCSAYIRGSTIARKASAAAGMRTLQVLDDNGEGLLLRQFLRAGRLEAWGVKFGPRSMAGIARKLAESGFEVTPDDIKNSGRKGFKLVPHCLTVTPETLRLLRAILVLFPDFDYPMVFDEGETGKLRAALGPSDAPSGELGETQDCGDGAPDEMDPG